MTALLKEVVTDSKLIKEIELKRTKVTGLVKNVLGGGHKADLAQKLQKKTFFCDDGRDNRCFYDQNCLRCGALFRSRSSKDM